MTVKELIKELQELEKKHGNLEVMFDADDFSHIDIDMKFWEILSVKQNICYDKHDKHIISIGIS